VPVSDMQIDRQTTDKRQDWYNVCRSHAELRMQLCDENSGLDRPTMSVTKSDNRHFQPTMSTRPIRPTVRSSRYRGVVINHPNTVRYSPPNFAERSGEETNFLTYIES